MMMEQKNLHSPAGKFFIIVFFELQKQRLLPTDLLFNLTHAMCIQTPSWQCTYSRTI